jgi:hypothetical protein
MPKAMTSQIGYTLIEIKQPRNFLSRQYLPNSDASATSAIASRSEVAGKY